MSREAALVWLGAASAAMLAAMLAGGVAAGWLFAGLAATFPVPLIALGAGPRAARGPLLGVLLALGAILGGATAAVLATGGREAAPGSWGLTPAAGWMLGGLGLAPLLLVVVSYAILFDGAEGPGVDREGGDGRPGGA